ncbi:MAG: hypothetical protein DRH51_06785, partial [Candidatus Coatesbacteria bacterium]
KLEKEEEEMVKTEELAKIQSQISGELPGFILCAVISVEDGLPLAGESSDPDYDLAAPSGAFAETYKSSARSFDYSNWGREDDILLEGKDVTVALFSLKDGKYLQGIAVKGSSTNVGMLRAVFRKYEDKLEASL